MNVNDVDAVRKIGRILLLAALILPGYTPSGAQTPHQVPFASTGNSIELILENSTQAGFADLNVELTEKPDWIRVIPPAQTITGIVLPGKPKTAAFTFDVDKSAPVGMTGELRFTVVSATGDRWWKSIPVKVLAPERFELLQNYPNPFNPSTTIAFILPRAAEVSLKVYTLLGDEVATLVNGPFEAGFHEARWNASTTASGVYVYRLVSAMTSLSGKMMVLK